MVNILAAPEGSGKTQKMTDLANNAVSMYNGNVVFIKKDHRNTKDFSFDLRVVCIDDYPTVRDEDALVSFILGMSAANQDIEAVFIDGVYQLIKVDVSDIQPLLERLTRASVNCDIEFFISVSAKPEDMKKYESEEIKILA